HVTIQTQFFFNKDLEYLRYGSKGSSPALSISKMKATSYSDFGLELLMLEKMWIDDVHLVLQVLLEHQDLLSCPYLLLLPLLVHLSDDEESENDHLPKADSRKDWWKPLPEEERPATLKPAWSISSSTISDVENN
nr:hypothetical protein [Tanacetum cinerariifolium]